MMNENKKKKSAVFFAIAMNTILFVGKLIGGILGHSSALISDSLDSLTDFVGDIVILGGIWFAGKPPDKKHPYGHYKAESLVTAIVGIMIVSSAILMLYRSIFSLYTGNFSTPKQWTGLVAFGSIIGCLITYFYLHRASKKYFSSALEAGAVHKFADALTSVAALIGIFLSSFMKIRWGDPVASAIVALWVSRTGIKIISRGGHELLDGAPDDDFEYAVEQTIISIPAVEKIHSLQMRTAGGKVFAHIDISVPSELSIADAHIISHRVRDVLITKFPRLANVIIHTEPCENESEIENEIITRVRQILTNYDKIKEFHGVDALVSENGFIIIADIVVDPEMKVKNAHRIADEIREKIIEIENIADAIIHIDYTRD
ncbi:cation diffusion facilitator family transporter [bacterium]|nr:cation diffusion facilitator family transporter [bacterium]